jgi:ABC-type transporter Mla maintaining outer membrane lipid asymmetry permease subunit MlaE
MGGAFTAVADDGSHHEVQLTPDDFVDSRGRVVLMTGVWSHQLGAKGARTFVEDLGGILIMAWQTVVWMVRPPYRIQNLFIQLEFVGVQSIFVVGLTGLFSGMVFALQTYHAFSLFNAQSLVGSTVALSLARELAPVFAGLMVTARVGSAMATELEEQLVTAKELQAAVNALVTAIRSDLAAARRAGAPSRPRATPSAAKKPTTSLT